MKISKTILLSLSSLLLLSACGGGTSQGGSSKDSSDSSNNDRLLCLTEGDQIPIIKDTYRGQISLTIMGACNSAINPDWAKNKFFTRISEETGIDFKFNVFVDGMYAEKKNLALSTGNNLPDIFFKGSLSNYDEVTYGGKTLIPLNDLIDNYAPHIKQILDDNPIIKKSITTADGNIYAIPTIYLNLPNNATTNMRGFLWINQTWMGETPMPKTPEELKAVLTKFKQNNCTDTRSFPLVVAGIDDLLRLFNMFGLDLVNYWVQGDGNGKLIFGPQTEQFKECLAFLRSLVKEGLMNPNWSTMTPTDVNAQASSGVNYGAFSQAAPQFVVGFDKMKQYTTLDPISPTGENGFWGALYPLQRGCYAITNKCKYPEVAMRFVDCLYNIEAPYGIWTSAGKEGEEWEWLDDGHTQWKSTISDDQYNAIMSKTIIQTGDGCPYAVDESFWEKQATETDLYTRPLRNRQMQHGYVGFPDVYFSKDNLKKMSQLAGDINIYIKRYIADVISGSKNLESDWTSFIKFNRLHLDEYLALLQERYDDFNAAIK